jgi:hypothetical protein
MPPKENGMQGKELVLKNKMVNQVHSERKLVAQLNR